MTPLPYVLETLLAPISAEQPEGSFDEENELYQAIDNEMVKLGGMRAATLDWAMVEEASARYLREQCKHFRILGHLTSAWLRHKEWESWTQSVQLVAGLLQSYWLTGFPRSGTDGMGGKRKQLAALGDRLNQSLKLLQPGSYSQEAHARASQAIEALIQAERVQGIVPSLAERLAPSLQLAADAAKRAPFEPARSSGPSPQQIGGDKVGADFFTTKSDSPLGNERETRRLYLKMAEYINQQDAYEPTGYLLRRYALWSGIHATPPIRHEQRTEMMSVPADITTEYQEALSGLAISPALLLRIEKSVAASPYWLRGSFLAALVAERLEMPVVALVIKTAAERFVRRMPTLRGLAFHDGTPFIDEETFAWISGAAGQSAPAASGKLAALQSELQAQQAEGEGVEAVLLRLQSMQSAGTSPRDRNLASVAAADALSARGLSWLAEDLYAGVARVMCSQQASDWEPDIYSYVAGRSGRHG